MLIFSHLEDPHVRQDAHGAEPDVLVAEADREEAAPGPHHVLAVETAHARVTRKAHGCSLFSVGLSDLYVRLCSMGVLSDVRIF